MNSVHLPRCRLFALTNFCVLVVDGSCTTAANRSSFTLGVLPLPFGFISLGCIRRQQAAAAAPSTGTMATLVFGESMASCLELRDLSPELSVLPLRPGPSSSRLPCATLLQRIPVLPACPLTYFTCMFACLTCKNRLCNAAGLCSAVPNGTGLLPSVGLWYTAVCDTSRRMEEELHLNKGTYLVDR